jgi:hypothetical protein
MTTAIEYALMAGASYIDNRPSINNRFPTPDGWVISNHQSKDTSDGVRLEFFLGSSESYLIQLSLRNDILNRAKFSQ